MLKNDKIVVKCTYDHKVIGEQLTDDNFNNIKK